MKRSRISILLKADDTSYGLPPDEDGKKEYPLFHNHFTQRRPNYAILQSTTQVLLRDRFACS